MKKIITLLLSVGAFATSFAQYNHQQNGDDRSYRTEGRWDDQYANSSNGNDRNWRHFNRGNIARARDFQIEKIDREFDLKVQAIQCDPYLRRREKKAAVRHAERERSRQIQIVNEKFSYNHWNH